MRRTFGDFLIILSVLSIPISVVFADWKAMNPPFPKEVQDIWAYDESHVYVTSSKHGVYLWNGIHWIQLENYESDYTQGIWGVTPDNLFVIGDSFFHFDGQLWTPTMTELETQIYPDRLWGSSDCDVFCAGSGNVFNYNGSLWKTMDFTFFPSLSIVSGISDTEVYFLSYYYDDPFGTFSAVINWDGHNWTVLRSDGGFFSEPIYRGIFAIEPGYLLAVGEQGLADLWNSNEWISIPKDTYVDLWDACGSGLDDFYIVGAAGTILHFNGVSVDTIPSCLDEFFIRIVKDQSNQYYILGDQGGVLMGRGNNWTLLRDTSDATMNCLWESSSDSIYAGGLTKSGESALWHWDGCSWRDLKIGDHGAIYDIDGDDGSDIYAVGDEIMHWDGNSWHQIDPPFVNQLNATCVLNDSTVYFVGKQGLILHWNGQNWIHPNSGTCEDLNDIWAADENDIYIAGDNGLFLKGHDLVWYPVPGFQGSGDITQICGISTDEIYLIDNRIMCWNGSDWSQMNGPAVFSCFTSIWKKPDGFLYLGGTDGKISVWDGVEWIWEYLNNEKASVIDLTGSAVSETIALSTNGQMFHSRASAEFQLKFFCSLIDDCFTPGTSEEVYLIINNNGNEMENAFLFIWIQIYGQWFFQENFTTWTSDPVHKKIKISQGRSSLVALSLNISRDADLPDIQGIPLRAAILNEDMTEILGGMSGIATESLCFSSDDYW